MKALRKTETVLINRLTAAVTVVLWFWCYVLVLFRDIQ